MASTGGNDWREGESTIITIATKKKSENLIIQSILARKLVVSSRKKPLAAAKRAEAVVGGTASSLPVNIPDWVSLGKQSQKPTTKTTTTPNLTPSPQSGMFTGSDDAVPPTTASALFAAASGFFLELTTSFL
ncbi:hypothetical protein RJ640_004202 [Escallonia rubra]|uniref:Uncharacterized protein n=1 Tax=Escallonia rubra TaxID=112253 RepID=A0AA88QUS1_9ASTE|nr:hypothetical protein RJ640_004202 [Escallonia rubra]